MSPLLEARELSVDIAGNAVCAGLTFALLAGERLAILGRNGVGKSTLLSVLAGLRRPQRGAVLLCGDDLAQLAPREAARRRGLMPQRHEDPFATTVLETALTGRHPWLGRFAWESEDDHALARAALAAVDLAGRDARRVDTLSGGERQRLAFAALLTQAPRVWLLDEPLAHLDLNHQVAVLELASARAREGAAVVMVLHDLDLAARYSDRVLLLHGAGEARCGPVDTLLEAGELSRLFGHPLKELRDGARRHFVPV